MLDGSHRRFFVFARVGTGSLHEEWTKGSEERSWDLQLSSYADNLSTRVEGDFPILHDSGTKIDSILRFLKAHPDVLDRYSYIVFPDDDLRFSVSDLNRLFQICEEEDLDLGAASLTWDSFANHAITYQCYGMKLRYTNFIEAMCPCFKTSYLKDIIHLFEGRYSGWGIDLVWALQMDDPFKRSAIIDAVGVTHTRPGLSGTIYEGLGKLGIDPSAELETVIKKYGISEGKIVYGAILSRGWRLGESSSRIINGLQLFMILPSARSPRFVIFRSAIGFLARSFISFKPRTLKLVVSRES